MLSCRIKSFENASERQRLDDVGEMFMVVGVSGVATEILAELPSARGIDSSMNDRPTELILNSTLSDGLPLASSDSTAASGIAVKLVTWSEQKVVVLILLPLRLSHTAGDELCPDLPALFARSGLCESSREYRWRRPSDTERNDEVNSSLELCSFGCFCRCDGGGVMFGRLLY